MMLKRIKYELRWHRTRQRLINDQTGNFAGQDTRQVHCYSSVGMM